MTNIKNLEKRIAKLEREVAMLKSNTHSEPMHHGKTHKHKQKGKKHKTKRKVNKFFSEMLKAKKAGKPSFTYNGKLYKGTKHNKLGMVYKKA